jgi:hypothetical protein
MRRVLLVVVSLVLSSACGSGSETGAPESGTTGSRTGTTTTGSATGGADVAVPEPPPAQEWPTTTDPGTGVTFRLPGEAKVETRAGNADGTTPDITSYQYEVAEDFGVTVSFAEAAAADYSAAGLAEVADMIVQQFTAQGATDAEVTDRHPSTIAGRPALDYRVSFTAKTGTKSIWLSRAIGDGTRVVQLQTIAFVDPADVAALTPLVERYHQTLVESVTLP